MAEYPRDKIVSPSVQTLLNLIMDEIVNASATNMEEWALLSLADEIRVLLVPYERLIIAAAHQRGRTEVAEEAMARFMIAKAKHDAAMAQFKEKNMELSEK